MPWAAGSHSPGLDVQLEEYGDEAKRRIVFDRVRNRFEAACAPEFSKLAVPRF
jgi:hypothetical protein